MSRRPQAYRGGHLVAVIDCSDLDRSAQFWTSLLGYARDGLPDGPYQSVVPADGQGIEILLQQVPETKREKTRLHILADPDGNEFCILQPPPGYWRTRRTGT